VVRSVEPRYVGHNPLGGWMIVVLLGTAALASASGWLSITDRFWGVAWVQDTHHVLGDGLIALVSLHVAGVLYTSLRQRENLVAAMLHGIKRPPRAGDVA
jgi:cytochrome b